MINKEMYTSICTILVDKDEADLGCKPRYKYPRQQVEEGDYQVKQYTLFTALLLL